LTLNEKDAEIDVKTGGHWFVRLLQCKGVEFVFGTTGAGMPDIQDAMVVEKPPKWIQGLHEFVTVNAASGYALASGKPGVALIDRVVGTQNSVGAFYGAYLNCSPVVVFASSNVAGVPIPTGETEYHYVTHQASFVAPWLKWSAENNSLDTLPEDVEKAFFMASSSHPGPTYLTLRQDLMAQRVQKGRVFKAEEPHQSPRVPDDASLEKILSSLLTHENPLVIASHMGRNPGAVFQLVDFAHTLGLPVRERRVFMNYPMSDAMHLGFVSRAATPELLPETDLVVLIETGLLPHQRFPDGVDVVDLASDALHRQDVYEGGDYGSSLVPAISRCVCDAEPTLRRLTKMARENIGPSDKAVIEERSHRVGETHRRMMKQWRENAKTSYDAGKLDGWSVGYVLKQNWSSNMTWVNGSVTPSEALMKALELSEPGTYFGNPSGHLGATLGMAYGVALAHRSYVDVRDMGTHKVGRISGSTHAVVCTTGDGDAVFGNIDSALWTCSHYGLGVLYIILNNAAWGIEWPPIARSSQQWAKRASDFEFVDLDNPRIDFAHLARAYNVHSQTVQTPQELDSAVKECLAKIRDGKPALLNVLMEKYTGPQPSAVP
jgi:thiamine pyrophosphate-dependent acetolactate synthase large subunit-like protein